MTGLVRKKIFSAIIITLMCYFGGTVYVASASTGDSSLPYSDYNARLASMRAISSLAEYYVEFWSEENGPAWLKRTQITAQFGGTPQFTLSTLQPLNDIGHSLHEVWYAVGNISSYNATANVGLGYRQLETDHSILYGANIFYDQQFIVNGVNGYSPSGSHQRLGAGLEWFYGPLELTVNGYYGLSPEIIVGTSYPNNIFQKAANGYDYNLTTDFSYLNVPWLNLTATGYQYFGSQVANNWGGDLKNYAVNATLNVLPRLTVSIGRDFGQSGMTLGFNFNLGTEPRPSLFNPDEVINESAATDLSYKMMQMPLRNNNITVEQYQRRMPSAVTVPVRDNLDTALTGVEVTLTSAPGATIPTSQTALSDIAGNATFNLPIAQSYAITVTQPPGYLVTTNPGTVNATANSETTTPVILTPQNVKPAPLTFTVTDSVSALPLAGVALNVPGILLPIFPTNSSGVSTVSNVPDIAYNGGVASVSGYATTSIPPIPIGVTQVAFTMVSIQQATVIGNITDESTGYPLPSATVKMTITGSQTGFNTTTDPNGNFTFNSIPYGNYTVAVSATNYQSTSQAQAVNQSAVTVDPPISLTPTPQSPIPTS
ncbi:MAG: inverse autotransporter beta domain-containing protein [Bacillota bacterium]